MRVVQLIGFYFLISGCLTSNGPRFTNSPSSSSKIFEPLDQVLSIHCHMEDKQETVKVRGVAPEYQYRFSPSCGDFEVSDNSNSAPEILNIMFVIDVTASMQSSIDSIKNGITTLSDSLTASNWQAKFAAVGFRDKADQMLQTALLDAKSFSIFLAGSEWQATGGGADYEENGQEAILTGVKRLSELAAKENRQNGLSVLVYISNAPGYHFSGDKNNYDTAELAALLNEETKNLPKFRFYYSVDSRFLPDGVNNKTGAPHPDVQMQELVSQLTVTEFKKLYYPFTTSVLNDFTKNFQASTDYKTLVCPIEEVDMESAPNQGIPGKDKKKNIYNAVSGGELINFALSPDAETSSYNMIIRRCCKYQLSDVMCVKEKKSVLRFEFIKNS